MDDIIKPFLHQHYLVYDEYEKQEARCDICNLQIDGWALTCESCNFWLHMLCAYPQLRPRISHPLHSQHSLTLVTYPEAHTVCDKCFTLTKGLLYSCLEICHSHFKLDLVCASSPTTTTSNDHQTFISENRERYKTIEHFCHPHELTPSYYRKVVKDHYTCHWCHKLLHLSGISYGCLRKMCGYEAIFFHESCLINMPTIIAKNRFHHPCSHPLYSGNILSSINYYNSNCNACKGLVHGEKGTYSCAANCEFYLHVRCATLIQPSLKLDVHDHDLTYFRIRRVTYRGTLPGQRCNKKIDEFIGAEVIFYACVQCDFVLHFSCTSIPFSIKHEYHKHELKISHSFLEDVFDEYYCDICEKERKPKDSVYCCEKCKFVAHIGCEMNKFIDAQLDHGSTTGLVDSKVSMIKPMEQEDSLNKNANFPTRLQVTEHFDHRHLLTFYEVLERNESIFCKACCLKISGQQVYGCESCEYYLHKTCTQLSSELLHPLHPHHSLKLCNASMLKLACNECSDCSDGFAYVCFICAFMLDVKCVFLSAPKDMIRRPKEREEKEIIKFCFFNQNHKLHFTNYGLNSRYHPECSFCRQEVVGPSYECFHCPYKLHESCLGFPLEMQLQFHHLHPFYPLPELFGDFRCSVCYSGFGDRFSYNCWECNIYLHPACAKALSRVVKSKSHQHNLYYFGPFDECDEYGYYNGDRWKECGECKGRIHGSTPFFFCMECDFKLHFECAQIPCSLKSKYHIHPLTLKDRFVEDDSREYYCDICEQKRYPEAHVYCCEECQGLFVAHIDCVLTSMEEAAPAIQEGFSNSVYYFNFL